MRDLFSGIFYYFHLSFGIRILDIRRAGRGRGCCGYASVWECVWNGGVSQQCWEEIGPACLVTERRKYSPFV
jgi:hypothetical protein